MLIEKLNTIENLKRTPIEISNPIVIHCAAGSGKTTLIKRIIEENRNILKAYTTSKHTLSDCSGPIIEEFKQNFEPQAHHILDEYPTLPKSITDKFGLILCDPYQYHCTPYQAHFTSNLSHRLGRNTTELLRNFGKDIVGYKDDIVEVANIFEGEPEGQITCCEEEIIELLEAHQADFLTSEEILGKEFKTVTFVTSKSLVDLTDHKSYICLTRHTEKIKILTPDAASSSGQ
jgi:hypothetical protein